MSHSLTQILPRSVAWLGYGGLLPFLTLAPASLLDHHHGPLWSDALFAYGAIILSFIGALHWAFAMTLSELSEKQRSQRFIWSVIPALLAWPAVLLSPVLAGPLLITGFLLHYGQDRRLDATATLPAWYLPLRFRLTTVAGLCLAAGSFAQYG
ncbi:MAG TPA: DUF3429 domain-containing protein [Azonexus sp.]|nr:DUF3429 domain-containing protein [Azonexus sp.]